VVVATSSRRNGNTSEAEELKEAAKEYMLKAYEAGATRFASANKDDLKTLRAVNVELRAANTCLISARIVLKQMLRAALERE